MLALKSRMCDCLGKGMVDRRRHGLTSSFDVSSAKALSTVKRWCCRNMCFMSGLILASWTYTYPWVLWS